MRQLNENVLGKNRSVEKGIGVISVSIEAWGSEGGKKKATIYLGMEDLS